MDTTEGVSIYNIIIDKLLVVSSVSVCRRVKDIYDVYLISKLNGIKLQKIVSNMNKRNLFMRGEFEDFINSYKMLEAEFYKLREISKDSKYEFNKIYSTVRDFFTPFILKDTDEDLIWNPNISRWEEIKDGNHTLFFKENLSMAENKNQIKPLSFLNQNN